MNKDTIKERIRVYISSTYELLQQQDFVLGELNYTLRCHYNSVQKVKEKKATKVFSCVAIDKTSGSVVVHFINQLKSGKYQDNTWGWLYVGYEYYIVKEIMPEEQEAIWNCLTDLKKRIVMANSTAFERFIYKIKANNFI